MRRQRTPSHAPLEFSRKLRMSLCVGGKAALPVGLARRARFARVPGGADLRGDLERLGRPAEARAGRGDLCRPEGGTVYLVSARLVGAAVTDHGLAAHERRPATVLARLRERRLDGRSVVAGDLAYDTPAVGLKAPRGVIGEPVLDAAVDADAVVVVDRHQFRQPQRSGKRARFVADAFHQTTVTHEYPRSVVDDRVARPIEFRGQELLGERHADRIGQPLPEWARGGFHPGRDSDLRMSGSLAVQLTKALQLFQRQRITGEVEQRIQQHRTVTIGKHEAVAVGPERIGGIVLQVPPPEHLGDVRHPQGHAGMTAVGGLDRVDREKAQRVAQFPPLDGLGSDLGIHAASLPATRVS